MFKEDETISSVMKEHARKIFEEFNPYRDWEIPLKNLLIVSCALSALIPFSILLQTETGDQHLLWVHGALTAAGIFFWALGRSIVQTEKTYRFKMEHADLANILWH